MQIIPQTFGRDHVKDRNPQSHYQNSNCSQQSACFNKRIIPHQNIAKTQFKSPLQELLSELIPEQEHYVQRLNGQHIIGYEAISELSNKNFPEGRSDYVDRILAKQRNRQADSAIADENSFTDSEIADETDFRPESSIADENESYTSEDSYFSPEQRSYLKAKKQQENTFPFSQLIKEFENLSIKPQQEIPPKEQPQITQDKDIKQIFSLTTSNSQQYHSLWRPIQQLQPILKKSKIGKKTERIVSFTEDNSLMLQNNSQILNQTCLSLRTRKLKFDISTIFDENEKITRKLPKESRFPWNENPLREAERMKEKYQGTSIRRLLNYIPNLYILPSEGNLIVAGDRMSFIRKIWKLQFWILVKSNQQIGPTQIVEGSTMQVQVFGGQEIQVDQTLTVNTIIRDILHLSNPSKKAVKVECELFFPV